jgi:LacI family transcriptional regulator
MECIFLPTQQEIASRANVSVSTVWRVLNHPDFVDSETRELVLAVATELGYNKIPIQKRKKKKSNIIAFSVSDLTNPFFSQIIRGCEVIARTHGYSLFISDSENDPELERIHMESFIENSVVGVILLPTGLESPAAETALRKKVPLVQVDRFIEMLNVSSITTDNFKGAYLACKYLLRIGHRDILFIYGGRGKSSADERLEGFKKALSESDIPFSEKMVINGGYDFDITYHNVSALLKNKMNFTAVFASADIMAFGVKRALEEHGYSIPHDVSLVGYDDIPLASSIDLTTVAQPALEMGRNAMFLLLDLIEGRVAESSHIMLQPSLIIRETCKGQ